MKEDPKGKTRLMLVLALSAVDRGFEPRSGQSKDYKIGICCFSAKRAALRSNRKDCLARIQNNVSEWGDMCISRLLFQWDSKFISACSSSTKQTSSSSHWKLTCSHHDIVEKLQRLVGSVWSDMFTRRLVSVSYHYTNRTRCVDLEKSGPHHHLRYYLLFFLY